MIKSELTLANDQEINELVEAFEQCTLDISHWTHRAHLAVGAYYARSLPRAEALAKMRECIQRFNASKNNPTGYNETITRLFLAKMAADIESSLACASLADEVRRLTDVCNLDWLRSYYSKALINSAEAKCNWVPPDLRPLEFEAL